MRMVAAALLLCGGAFSAGLLLYSAYNAAIFESPQVVARAPLSPQHQRIVQMANRWQKTPQFGWTFNALRPAQAAGLASAAYAMFDNADAYSGLPRKAGYELVDASCSGCHSLQIVMQQRATPARWADLLDWMVRTQNMPELHPDDHSIVLAYLSENFGAQP